MGHFEAHGSAVPPFSIEPHFRPSVPGKTGPRKFFGSPRTTWNRPILSHPLYLISVKTRVLSLFQRAMRHRLLLLLAAALPATALADLGGHSHGNGQARRRGRQETNEIQESDSEDL